MRANRQIQSRCWRECLVIITSLWMGLSVTMAAEQWRQLQGNARRLGDAAHIRFSSPLRLARAIPTTDALLAAPIISDGQA